MLALFQLHDSRFRVHSYLLDPNVCVLRSMQEERKRSQDLTAVTFKSERKGLFPAFSPDSALRAYLTLFVSVSSSGLRDYERIRTFHTN